ncbi:hypothetical protein [Nitrospira sp. BLG_1]|uniref:hypothetical protein n=1 Tax=Nitrospira sp. BLG_1 TaxID=3395883 RepID=UPI0039BC2785
MLALKAILAGSGNLSDSQQAPVPSGIGILEIKSTRRVQRGRSVPVTIRINQDREHLSLKFMAEKDVFQRLASFHNGDESSDTRFGYLIGGAVREAQNHVRRSQLFKRKDNGRPFQRMAYSTAVWLGPALLDRLKLAMESSSPIIKIIRSCATKEHRGLRLEPEKIAARNLAAFLVYKNWQNWRGRLQKRGVTISEWPTKISPIKRVEKGSAEGEGEYESHDFWDEIFNRKLKLKRFPWKTLERTDPDRFKELTTPGIETAKVRYAQDNPGFSWKKCQDEQPDQYERLIDKFLRNHMALNRFALNSRVSQQAARRLNWPVDSDRALKKDPQTGDWFVTVPTTGPTFPLPKSLEETVRDILLDRDVFILYHDFVRPRSCE